MALVEGPVVDERLEVRPWRKESMVVIGPKDFSPPSKKTLRAKELSSQTWILREPGSGSRGVVEAELERLGISPAKTIEAGSNEIIVQMAATGLGIGMVPQVAAADAITLNRISAITLEEGEITRELYRPALAAPPDQPRRSGVRSHDQLIPLQKPKKQYSSS